MPPTSPPPPASPSSPGGGGAAVVRLLYGVAAAAAAAYSSPPRQQQEQMPRQEQQQHSPPPPPPPRAASPPPARPPQEQQQDGSTSSSSLPPLFAALWESLLRLALRLSGLSDAVWARAVAAAGGLGGPVAAAATTTTTTAPRLALALNGALARVSRSAQAALGVPFLKPSLREIATYVRAVEIEAQAASSSSSSSPSTALLSRQDADAALALCVRHSLPAFFRAFRRRYAVSAATGALAVGFARDVLLPVLLILWPLRLFGALARCLVALPFVSGPILGVAVACGSEVHGDPSWAFTEFASWVQGRVVWAAAQEGPPSSASSFAADGWADGGADVDMVDELLAEASAYLDALNNSSSRRAARGAGGGGTTGDDAPAAVAADLGARVLRALRHRRAAAAAAAAAPPAGGAAE